MMPYYDEGGITIYHGDAFEIVPQLVDVDAVVADPPYGIGYRFPTVILWGANNYADRLPASRGWLVWDKRLGTGPNDQGDCELAWTNRDVVARLFSRFWNGAVGPERRLHPAQKPIEVMRWCLELIPSAQLVLDPYMGSGTTLRAAKDLGRRAIGIEIEERYCEIAATRLAQEALKL